MGTSTDNTEKEMPITPDELLIITTLAIVIAAPTINHLIQLFIQGE